MDQPRVWEHEIKLFGVAAGRQVRIRGGQFEDLGRNVADQGDRIKRLVNARLRRLIEAELGGLPTAKVTPGTVMALLDGVGREDDPAQPEKPSPAARNKKPAAG